MILRHEKTQGFLHFLNFGSPVLRFFNHFFFILQRLKTEFCHCTAPRVLPHEPVLETGLFGPEFPPELAELAGIPVEIWTERAAVAGGPHNSCF